MSFGFMAVGLSRAFPLAALSLLIFSGCASTPPGQAATTTSRAAASTESAASAESGPFLRLRNPNLVFRVPSGWREATASDYESFGRNQRVLERLVEPARSQFLLEGARHMSKSAAVLISSRGAWLDVRSDVNPGVRFPSGYRLNEQEKQIVWRGFSAMVARNSPPTDPPALTLKSMDVSDYGPSTALRIRYLLEAQRGAMHGMVLVLFSPTHVVCLSHVGIPDDPNEGLQGIEAVARSFRFE